MKRIRWRELDRSDRATTASGIALASVEPASMLFGSESNPGFREKLAEREEARPVGRLLIHIAFLKAANIRTIKIRPERSG